MLEEADLMEALRRHWEYSGKDEDVAHEIYHLISYDGGPWMFTVNLLECRGYRVAHERIYIMNGWDAAEWRAPWRSDMPADQPPPPISSAS